MGKDKRLTTGWISSLQGPAVALVLYLVWILVLAFLIVKGILPEHTKSAAIAIGGLAASALGGRLAVGRSSMVPAAAMLSSAILLLALVLAGGVGWPEASRSSQCLLCGSAVLVGGFLGGISGRGKRRGGKKRRGSAGRK